MNVSYVSVHIHLYKEVCRVFKSEFFQRNKETELFRIYVQEPKTAFAASNTTNVLNNSHTQSSFKLKEYQILR